MNMKKLLISPPGQYLSSEECHLLNYDLSKKDISDIPVNARKLVEDYLTAALVAQSVDISIENKLDELLVQLQSI